MQAALIAQLAGNLISGDSSLKQIELIDTKPESQLGFYLTAGILAALGIGAIALLVKFSK